MFCLRSWLPLLFIPTNAPPIFVFLFFLCTFFLSRPCVYCSFLLVILFMTSCQWSDRCFFDFHSDWFQSRPVHSILPSPSAAAPPVDDFTSTVTGMINSTVTTLASAAVEEMSKKRAEWTGLGMEWLRSLLGKREWRIDCLDVYIRL